MNLGVGKLPQEEVAEPHLAAGADHEIEIRQMTGVQIARYGFFIYLQVIESAVARCGIDQ